MKINKSKNDVFLIAAVSLLLTIGLIMVFSASAFVAHERHGSLIFFFRKQIFWGFLCILGIFIFSRLKINFSPKPGFPLYLVLTSIVLLFGLFIWGDVVNGARRWYNLGPASFQPSEFAKLCLIIYFADIFSRKSDLLHDWQKGLLPHLIILGLVLVPIFLQPDLGTVIMITIIIGTMAFLSNVRFKHVLAGSLFLLPLLIIKIRSSSYQFKRIMDWWENLNNPLGSGYQIKQSLIGLGRGGLVGNGVGTSKQKFYFLPDSHTDFVFAIVGEEIGFIGTTLILLLFLVILWRGISIAKRARSPFAQYLAIGVTLNLVLYAFMNAAVTTMLVPTTGIPMPFISYGGSSLLFTGIMIGLLINIARNSEHATMVSNRSGGLRSSDISRTLIMSE